MYMYTQGHSRLISTGVYIPEQVVTSREIMERVDSMNRFGLSYDWLERMMGIKERRVAPQNLQPSDMAAHAAKQALEMAGIASSEIDAIIYTGVAKDCLEPATAHLIQDKIQAYNAVVFDVTNACHGFMNGIHLMDALIATGQARRGLIVTGEQGSFFATRAIKALRNTEDRELFLKLVGGLTLGDAGAAMIMGPKLGPDSGFLGFMLQSQGQYSDLCIFQNGGEDIALYTDMPSIVKQHIQLHADMFGKFMNKLKWKPDQISRFVHHQTGLKGFKLHAQYSGIPMDRMPNTVNTMGNLITATIPINLYNLSRNKEINNGDKIFIAGAGSGLSITQAGLMWEAA